MFSVCRHYKDSGRKSPVGGGQVHTVKILTSLAEGGHYDPIILALKGPALAAALSVDAHIRARLWEKWAFIAADVITCRRGAPGHGNNSRPGRVTLFKARPYPVPEGAPVSAISVRHRPDRDRFEILDAGNVIGKAVYRDYDGDGQGQRIFYHTVINEEYGGQGLAGQLATVGLTATVEAGLGIVPVCPFIKKFLVKHPEFAGSAVPVRPAHLAFLDAALAAPTPG